MRKLCSSSQTLGRDSTSDKFLMSQFLVHNVACFTGNPSLWSNLSFKVWLTLTLTWAFLKWRTPKIIQELRAKPMRGRTPMLRNKRSCLTLIKLHAGKKKWWYTHSIPRLLMWIYHLCMDLYRKTCVWYAYGGFLKYGYPRITHFLLGSSFTI